MTRLIEYLRQSLRGIWFRAALFTVAGIVLAVVAHFLGSLLPTRVSVALGKDSAASLLQILATSMLAVTTFSLTTMVSAYANATRLGTPRSIQLLIADRTSHNALSTFVGAFAFSIVGIAALSLNAYTEPGQTFLFWGTILVIAIVLVTLLRWISFLTTFGRMADIIDRVEDAASKAMREYAADPLLGGQPWVDPPSSAVPVLCDRSGFVVKVDVAALQRIAEQENCMIWVQRRAGSRLFAQHPVAYLGAGISQEAHAAVQRAFVIESHRTFEQDPRLGLIALSEISSRALSPGINDPGTAVEVLSATHSVLGLALRASSVSSSKAPRVHLREIEPRDMLEDAYRPVSRDGSAFAEVMMRVQRELGALIAAADGPWTAALRAQAVDSFRRAERALQHPADIDEVALLHAHALSLQATGRDSAPQL